MSTTDVIPLLKVENLSVSYRQGFRNPPLRAVDQVSFSIGAGETVSIVGESGSGKSTIGSTILGLVRPESGRMRFEGEDITKTGQRQRRALSARLQAVFQDPFSSLDPAKTIGESVSEPLIVGTSLPAAEIRQQTAEVLRRVGVGETSMNKYPSEFSGGQRQRIAIARAIIRSPSLVVADEAVSALDVSVQAMVLNLLDEFKREHNTSYLFISHNMAVVRHISDRVVVLYRGRVMEEGPAIDTCDRPAHPYTRSLIAAVPVPNVISQRARREQRAEATTVSGFPASSETGCPFAPRCPFAQQRCVDATPPLVEYSPGRKAACVRIGEIGEMPTSLQITASAR